MRRRKVFPASGVGGVHLGLKAAGFAGPSEAALLPSLTASELLLPPNEYFTDADQKNEVSKLSRFGNCLH